MSVKSVVRSYWDLRSQTYDRTVHKSENGAKNFWKDALRDTIRMDRNLNILDVGTGTGFLALIFAEMGHKVTGIDISRCMLEKSRNKADKLRLAVDFMHGDAENLPFEDETFDIVVNRYLLWTMPDPEHAIDEWSRVVKSGGKLVLIDGKWHDSTIDMRLRRLFNKMKALITEKRNPLIFERYYYNIRCKLPLFVGSTPEDVADLFTGVGLRNVSVDHLERLREFENKPSLFLALGEK
ncbi:MAG TPA: class I SAM-dependent methyltransferase [Methanosarcinales archaeon]|nr:class I SAM-dependent methyltransferase [Methanosarcinales archaeon]